MARGCIIRPQNKMRNQKMVLTRRNSVEKFVKCDETDRKQANMATGDKNQARKYEVKSGD